MTPPTLWRPAHLASRLLSFLALRLAHGEEPHPIPMGTIGFQVRELAWRPVSVRVPMSLFVLLMRGVRASSYPSVSVDSTFVLRQICDNRAGLPLEYEPGLFPVQSQYGPPVFNERPFRVLLQGLEGVFVLVEH